MRYLDYNWRSKCQANKQCWTIKLSKLSLLKKLKIVMCYFLIVFCNTNLGLSLLAYNSSVKSKIRLIRDLKNSWKAT